MTRYVALFVNHDSDGTSLTADTVVETENDPVNTGLLDLDGRAIYRVRDREPIGFAVRPRIRIKAHSRRVGRGRIA